MWRSCHSAPSTTVTPSPSTAVTPSLASVATQTDAGFPSERVFGFNRAPAEPLNCLHLHNVDRTKSRSFPVEADDRRWLPGEMESTTYEEISLHRSSKDAKFGLTLWYQTGNYVNCLSENVDYDDSGTKVYIGEIEPGGSAAKDGRARIGDRITRINGEHVKSRDQVLKLLRSDLPFINLLLSRSSLVGQDDDGFTDDLEALECLSFEDENEDCAVQLECIDEEDGATDDTGTTENDSQRQDSGFGKTDDSTRNEESSEQEAIDDCVLSPLADTDCSLHDRHQKSSDSFGSMDWHESDPDAPNQDELPSIFQCQQFYEMLKERCNADLALSAGTSRFFRTPGDVNHRPTSSTRDDYAVLERPRQFDDVAIIGREVAALHLEDHAGGHAARSGMGTRKVPRMGTKIEFGRQVNPASSKEKTNFVEQYFAKQSPQTHTVAHSNEGGSVGGCLLFDSFQNLIRFSSSGPDSHGQQTPTHAVPLPFFTEAVPSKNPSTRGTNSSDSIRKTQTSQMCQTDDEGDYESLVPLDYRIPNMAARCNCQVCMLPQGCRQSQEILTQIGPSGGSFAAKIDRNSAAKRTCDESSQSLPKSAETVVNNAQGTPVAHEWVVKRRSDGSRYITRRPVRNRASKERIRRTEEEKSYQTTTDDDAASEHKTGRYLTKEDRRRHMEKNRNRRREKAATARQRATDGSDQCARPEDQPNIMQLSEKKMMKCRKVFDDFTTLQEILAHGSRDPRQTPSINHLLSVTTV